MPAPPRYLSPHEQVLRLAVVARREGLTFEEFWTRALRPRICADCLTETLLAGCPSCGTRCHPPLDGRPATVTVRDEAPDYVVRFPTDTADKRAWVAALEASRETFRRAWHHEPPTPADGAFAVLAAGLGRVMDAAPAGGFDDRAAVA